MKKIVNRNDPISAIKISHRYDQDKLKQSKPCFDIYQHTINVLWSILIDNVILKTVLYMTLFTHLCYSQKYTYGWQIKEWEGGGGQY